MTHTEKQFLYEIGEEDWTDTWFDIFPEEVWQMIYRHLNAKTIKRLSDPFCEKHQDMILEDYDDPKERREWVVDVRDGDLHSIYLPSKLDYDKQEMINYIEKIPICGNELKKIRDNPPNKFITYPGPCPMEMEYAGTLPPGCEKLPMKYITKSGQVYVFTNAIQKNRGGGRTTTKISITIDINYREVNGGELLFSKKLENKDLSKKAKASTLKHTYSNTKIQGIELKDIMEQINWCIRSRHDGNEEVWKIKTEQKVVVKKIKITVKTPLTAEQIEDILHT